MTAIVTKDSLQAMLDSSDRSFVTKVIGRALVGLFNRQTESEKAVNTTQESNGVGFAGCDAVSGTLSAKYFLKHGTLLDWQAEKWLKKGKNGYSRLSKYHGQLNEIAVQKKAK